MHALIERCYTVTMHIEHRHIMVKLHDMNLNCEFTAAFLG